MIQGDLHGHSRAQRESEAIGSNPTGSNPELWKTGLREVAVKSAGCGAIGTRSCVDLPRLTSSSEQVFVLAGESHLRGSQRRRKASGHQCRGDATDFQLLFSSPANIVDCGWV